MVKVGRARTVLSQLDLAGKCVLLTLLLCNPLRDGTRLLFSSFPTTVAGRACSGRRHSLRRQHVFPTGLRALSSYSIFVLCLGFEEPLKTTLQKGLVPHWQSRHVDQAQQSIPRVWARCRLDKSSSEKTGSNVQVVI